MNIRMNDISIYAYEAVSEVAVMWFFKGSQVKLCTPHRGEVINSREGINSFQCKFLC